jgi:hypothetical protein
MDVPFSGFLSWKNPLAYSIHHNQIARGFQDYLKPPGESLAGQALRHFLIVKLFTAGK